MNGGLDTFQHGLGDIVEAALFAIFIRGGNVDVVFLKSRRFCLVTVLAEPDFESQR